MLTFPPLVFAVIADAGSDGLMAGAVLRAALQCCAVMQLAS